MAVVPDYRGRFLQGHETGKNVGDRLEAGLPNITGHIRAISENIQTPNEGIATGAFYLIGTLPNLGVSQNFGGKLSYVNFDASRSSRVYGNSTTVQPPAVVVKYIIKAE